jgi:hypothetical protein
LDDPGGAGQAKAGLNWGDLPPTGVGRHFGSAKTSVSIASQLSPDVSPVSEFGNSRF